MENALEFLLEQSQAKEEKAILALNKARSELDNYYQQLKQIEQYRLDYCHQLVERGKSGLTASQYGHLNRFLTQLDSTLDKQREAEQHFKTQVIQCENFWLEMRKQRRSYEWLMEKKRQEKEKQLNRQEQKMMDEFASLLSARRNRTL